MTGNHYVTLSNHFRFPIVLVVADVVGDVALEEVIEAVVAGELHVVFVEGIVEAEEIAVEEEDFVDGHLGVP